MKRIVKLRYQLVVLLVMLCSLTSIAQDGLEINAIFNGRYSSDPKVTETIISGNNKFLKSHHLNVLATFRGPASTYGSMIEKLVLADAKKAVGRNVRYKDGQLYFGLFMLAPAGSTDEKRNRYLYYLNNASRKSKTVLVVYLEGTLNEEQVSEVLRSIVKGK